MKNVEFSKSQRFAAAMALVLFLAQLLLILVSWIYSAAFPMSGVRSLLSGEGLRWFMGSFADVLATPLLVWLLLLAMAFGVLRRSGLLHFRQDGEQPLTVRYRKRRARLLTTFLAIVFVVVMLLLTLLPHAVLLSATGSLWPSPFSRSLIPVMAFCLMLLSVSYGLMAGRLTSLCDIYDALIGGIQKASPLFLFYVLIIQIYESLRFVFLQNPNF